MATKHPDIKGYCDSLYRELFEMKNRLFEFKTQIEQMEGAERDTLNSHVKHLDELIQSVDWKMEIFSKSCPVDWGTFHKQSEASTSVPPGERDISAGGYVGG